MGIFKVIVFGIVTFLGMIAWSWVRAQKHRWVRRHRGTLGWVLSAMVMALIVMILRVLVP